MTNESPIHSATLQIMAEAICNAEHPADGLASQSWAAWHSTYETLAAAALRAFLQSADGKAIREALESLIREAQAVADDHHHPRYARLDEALTSAKEKLALLAALEKECL